MKRSIVFRASDGSPVGEAVFDSPGLATRVFQHLESNRFFTDLELVADDDEVIASTYRGATWDTNIRDEQAAESAMIDAERRDAGRDA